ncbi:hypothetical protein AB0J38_14295 [Streptomyces sp. NPDC050095]|uniref:Acb2/Tad1 domain-containing protein n=1 Tax=unclassified Streptomyces TaxID=2593676 RepID=UPI0034318C46
MTIGAEELATRFTFHPATAEQAAKYEELRALALNFALTIDEHVPDSREKSLALTHLDETVMFANAGIARRDDEQPSEPPEHEHTHTPSGRLYCNRPDLHAQEDDGE